MNFPALVTCWIWSVNGTLTLSLMGFFTFSQKWILPMIVLREVDSKRNPLGMTFTMSSVPLPVFPTMWNQGAEPFHFIIARLPLSLSYLSFFLLLGISTTCGFVQPVWLNSFPISVFRRLERYFPLVLSPQIRKIPTHAFAGFLQLLWLMCCVFSAYHGSGSFLMYVIGCRQGIILNFKGFW